ncbi:MAG: MFS transporter [Candidatus Bathyarchaeia archaeon]|jgi:MFS family permease
MSVFSPEREWGVTIKNLVLDCGSQLDRHVLVDGVSHLLNPSFRRVLPAYVIVLLWNVSWSVTITGPVLPLYIETLGIGIVGWSTLAAMFALGMFLFEWVWGSLSDRTNRRHLLIFSLLCMSAIFVLYTRHGSFFFFLVLQLLSGAVGVVVGPTTRASVSEESSLKSAGLYASLWWVSSSIGRIIGPLIGTYIAQGWSFEYSFYASSALSVLLIFIVLWSFPPSRKLAGRSKSMIYGLNSTLRRRSAQFLFLSAIFAFMGFSIVRTFLPLYASGVVGMSTVEVGTLISIVAASQLVAILFLGWFSDRFGRKPMTIIAFLLCSGSFLLYLFANTAYQIFLVSIAAGLGLSATSLLLAIVPDVTPKRMYGTVVGIYGSCEDLGIMVGPLVYGLVWSTIGPVYIFMASSVTQVLSAALVFAIKQKRSSNP